RWTLCVHYRTRRDLLCPTIHDRSSFYFLFFFNDPATTDIYTLSLHDALPILDIPSSFPACVMLFSDCLRALRRRKTSSPRFASSHSGSRLPSIMNLLSPLTTTRSRLYLLTTESYSDLSQTSCCPDINSVALTRKSCPFDTWNA